MIKVTGVDKKFDNFKALDRLDIHVKKGSIYGLVGTNGAGKTTIIKGLVGIQKPDAGSIQIDGEDVFENAAVKGRIGYVSDDIFFFSGYSLADMRRYFKGIYPNWRDGRFNFLVKEFQLPEKLKLSAFSKGMRKQAALICALSSTPDVLILDEPIDGLDPVVRLKVWKHIISDVADREMTVLVSSHNLREMEGYCDHIGIISDGHMVIERDLEDLKTNVHKIQVAFKDCDKKPFEGLNILHKESRGAIDLLIVKDKKEKIEQVIGEANPTVFDLLPLSLEEIFIYELGGVSDEIHGII